MGMLTFMRVYGDAKYTVFVEEVGAEEGSAIFPSLEPQNIALDNDKTYLIQIPLPNGSWHREEIPGTTTRNMTQYLIGLGF